jgi:hypothetical protein
METPHDKRPVGPACAYAKIINWSRAVFVPVSQSLSPRRFNGRVGFNHKDHKGGTKNTKNWLVRFTVGNICGVALTGTAVCNYRIIIVSIGAYAATAKIETRRHRAPLTNEMVFDMRPTMESTIDTVSVSPADGAPIRFCTSFLPQWGWCDII